MKLAGGFAEQVGLLFLSVPGLFAMPALAGEVDDGCTLPPAEYNLKLAAPVLDWYEGIPLGNGQLGALIWGRDNQVVVKLDRLDIWDERFEAGFEAQDYTWRKLREDVEARRAAMASGAPPEAAPGYERKLFFGSWAPPTHVPIGKLTITLPGEWKATWFTLDLGRAEAGVEFQEGQSLAAVACAAAPVIMLSISGGPQGVDLWAPGVQPEWPASFSYGPPVMGRDPTAWWYEQSVPEGTNPGYSGSTTVPAWKFVVYVQQQADGDHTLLLATVTSSQTDGPDPLAAARARVARALETGRESLLAGHRERWSGFWGRSSLTIPDQTALQHYYLSRYFLGASSAPGFPAMGVLQSVWTDNQFPTPAFRNNLHNDLETQVQYQSYQVAGDFSEGRVFLNYLHEMLPVWRGFARRFYGTGGAAVPGVMSLGGNPTGGWPQYQLSPTYAGWFGWLFYQHWRYTQDREFLATTAYPWCVEIAECWSQLLEADQEGILRLPLSSSSEIFNDSLRAWLKPNSNQDRDMMQTHLLGLAEMADALGKGPEAARWRELAGRIGPRQVDEEDALMWSEGEKVRESHRHLSHVMSVWPFNALTVDGDDHDRQIIAATLRRLEQYGDRFIDERAYQYGRIGWMGFTWPWMSSIYSRVGDAESAYMHLDIFLKGFIARNGFHLNRDIHGVLGPKEGLVDAKGACLFTTEGSMLANQAVHDMLIQSWSPSIGRGEAGVVRLFPATPWLWHDASFSNLRAEGAFRVSARRANNATVWFRITAEAEGLLRLRNNFGGRAPKWVGPEMANAGRDFERLMQQGEVVEASLEVPQEVPPRPGNAWQPRP